MEAHSISKQLFAEHIYDLLNRSGYYQHTWSIIDDKNYAAGIFGRLVDKNIKIIIVKILYNEKYPKRPPIVHSSPPIRDACWDSKGFLHFAIKGDFFAWNSFRKHSNPLIYLIDELVLKYKVV